MLYSTKCYLHTHKSILNAVLFLIKIILQMLQKYRVIKHVDKIDILSFNA